MTSADGGWAEARWSVDGGLVDMAELEFSPSRHRTVVTPIGSLRWPVGAGVTTGLVIDETGQSRPALSPGR